MNNEEIMQYIKSLEEKVDHLEFKQSLMLDRSHTNDTLLEYNVTEAQYRYIMDIMDDIRKKLDQKQNINNAYFENKVLKYMNRDDVDYHFCEYITMAFMKDGRWEEVFPALYGSMAKYQYLKEGK